MASDSPLSKLNAPALKEKSAVTAIRRASEATGVDFSYLLATAKRESALNPMARAKTSSAEGLFQFIDQTWLATIKNHGRKHGLGEYAQAIYRRADGRFDIANPGLKNQIMDLKFDPSANAVMAAELTRAHSHHLENRLGRTPTKGELYAAHFLGPEGAAKLILAKESNPDIRAANIFPAAASANTTLFYRKGEAVSVAALYQNLTKGASSTIDMNEVAGPEPEAFSPMIMRVRENYDQQKLLMALLLGDADESSEPSSALALGLGTSGFGRAFGDPTEI
jgi:hypothetical protein